MEGTGSKAVDNGGSSSLGDPAPRLTRSGQLPGGGEDTVGYSKQLQVSEPG